MGRLIAYDDLVQEKLSCLVSNSSGIALGVIIGQATSSRDIVTHVAACPRKDVNGGSESTNSSSSNSEVANSPKRTPRLDDIDEQWICLHAKQVNRMLPGGIDILGLVAIAPQQMLDASIHQLKQTLHSVFKMLRKDPSQLSLIYDHPDRVLLQICSLTRKTTCRTMNVSQGTLDISPAEWKIQSQLPRWYRIDTSFSPQLSDHIVERQSFVKQIQKFFSPLVDEISEAVALINGELRDEDDILLQEAQDKRGKTKKLSPVAVVNFTVDLLLPTSHRSDDKSAPSGVQVNTCEATMAVNGTMRCRAFVHSRATVKEAVIAIKQDILRSLTARYEIHCEDLLLIENEQDDPCVVHELPKRVWVNPEAGVITFCDYIFHSDDACDSMNAFADLLGLTSLSSDDIELDVEISPESNQEAREGAEVEEILTEATETLSKSGRSLLVPVLSVAVAVLAICVVLLSMDASKGG